MTIRLGLVGHRLGQTGVPCWCVLRATLRSSGAASSHLVPTIAWSLCRAVWHPQGRDSTSCGLGRSVSPAKRCEPSASTRARWSTVQGVPTTTSSRAGYRRQVLSRQRLSSRLLWRDHRRVCLHQLLNSSRRKPTAGRGVPIGCIALAVERGSPAGRMVGRKGTFRYNDGPGWAPHRRPTSLTGDRLDVP